MLEIIEKLFCALGIHWLKDHRNHFTDYVSGLPVFVATCSCDRDWMVDTTCPIAGFKDETERSIERRKSRTCEYL